MREQWGGRFGIGLLFRQPEQTTKDTQKLDQDIQQAKQILKEGLIDFADINRAITNLRSFDMQTQVDNGEITTTTKYHQEQEPENKHK